MCILAEVACSSSPVSSPEGGPAFFFNPGSGSGSSATRPSSGSGSATTPTSNGAGSGTGGVKVILNQTFPGGTSASDTNASSYATLQTAGVDVVWTPADPDGSSSGYTHEKTVIIDPGGVNEQAWIMTMNLDTDAPKYNREMTKRDASDRHQTMTAVITAIDRVLDHLFGRRAMGARECLGGGVFAEIGHTQLPLAIPMMRSGINPVVERCRSCGLLRTRLASIPSWLQEKGVG